MGQKRICLKNQAQIAAKTREVIAHFKLSEWLGPHQGCHPIALKEAILDRVAEIILIVEGEDDRKLTDVLEAGGPLQKVA